MYERFTDRARKAMQRANREAQKLNHEYLSIEHILLAVSDCDVGIPTVVARAIASRTIRQEAEKLLHPGPDLVTMGKMPQTPRAKKVLEYAMEEAQNLGHNWVGSQHLFLGLLREKEGIAVVP